MLLLLLVMRHREHLVHVVERVVHHRRLTAICGVVQLDNPADNLLSQTTSARKPFVPFMDCSNLCNPSLSLTLLKIVSSRRLAA